MSKRSLALEKRTRKAAIEGIQIRLPVSNDRARVTQTVSDRLNGAIRERTRFRKNQRAKMSGWSFHQLRTFIEYKAAIGRVPVVAVDPKYTSQTCSQCGHREKANRKSQSEFDCRRCGFKTHADFNGALNVSARARVSAPKVSEKRPKNREVQGQAPSITR